MCVGCTLYSAQHAIYHYIDPEFQSLNLAGQGLSGLNSGTETPASVPLPSTGFMRPKARGLVQHGGPLEESDPARCFSYLAAMSPYISLKIKKRHYEHHMIEAHKYLITWISNDIF